MLGDEALAVTELQPKSGFYDYDAKYTDGMTEHVCPAEVPDEIAAGDAGHGARGAPRCSAAAAPSAPISAGTTSRARRGCYLLEINTQPGMTPLSLVPEQAQARGIDYAELVERLIAEALAEAARDERGASPPRPARRQAAPAQAKRWRCPKQIAEQAAGRSGAAPTGCGAGCSPPSCWRSAWSC